MSSSTLDERHDTFGRLGQTMQLHAAKKIYASSFCATPEQTVDRIREGFRRLGLEITYTANATAPSRWFSTSVAAPVLGTFSGHAHVRGMPPQFGTNGKGMSHRLAMASAFGELCERYSVGVLHSYYSAYARDRGLVSDQVYDYLANVKFLAGHVVGPREQIAQQLELDPILRQAGMSDAEIGRLFELPISRNWVDGYSLVQERAQKVPLTLLTTLTGSNGMAAGNTTAEAITHAMGELFERYCTWKIVLGGIDCPTIARDSIVDEEVLGVLRQFDDAGIEVTIKDFSLGGTFPVVGTLFRNRNLEQVSGPAARPCQDHFGYTLRAGSAPRSKEALLRCLTEEMQGVLLHEYTSRQSAVPLWSYWIGEMGRSYEPRSNEALIQTGVDRRDFNRHGDVRFLERGEDTSFQALWNWDHEDCLGDVEESLAICRRLNADAVVVDTTHPVIGFPSVVVFVPQFLTCSNVFENVRQTVAHTREQLQLGHPATLAQRLPTQHFELSDGWLEHPEAMRDLTRAIEGYLAAFFPSHQWHTWRRLWPVNLCQLLAYLHLAQGDHQQAIHMSELWRITGATPSSQRAAAQLGRLLRQHQRDREQDALGAQQALAAGLAELDPEHRFLVTTPRLNPFRYLADQPEPLPWEAEWNRLLHEEYRRFFESFQPGAQTAAQPGAQAGAAKEEADVASA